MTDYCYTHSFLAREDVIAHVEQVEQAAKALMHNNVHNNHSHVCVKTKTGFGIEQPEESKIGEIVVPVDLTVTAHEGIRHNGDDITKIRTSISFIDPEENLDYQTLGGNRVTYERESYIHDYRYDTWVTTQWYEAYNAY